MAGGATVDEAAYINGGPMMGKLVTSLDAPVTKTTGGLIALPADHILIQRRTQSERSALGIARTTCEQCMLCTELWSASHHRPRAAAAPDRALG